MKKTLVVLILSTFYLCAQAQVKTDTIAIWKFLDGNTYRLGKKNLSTYRMTGLFEDYPVARTQLNKAKSNHAIGFMLGFTGGFLLGLKMADLATNKETSWTPAGIGLGLIGLSVPFNIGYNSHSKKAVKYYNNAIQGRIY